MTLPTRATLATTVGAAVLGTVAWTLLLGTAPRHSPDSGGGEHNLYLAVLGVAAYACGLFTRARPVAVAAALCLPGPCSPRGPRRATTTTGCGR